MRQTEIENKLKELENRIKILENPSNKKIPIPIITEVGNENHLVTPKEIESLTNKIKHTKSTTNEVQKIDG